MILEGLNSERAQQMTTPLKLLSIAAMASTMLATAPLSAQAGGVLRLDEVAVGELDPAIASDYADSILMFNVYDTLVLPAQGAPRPCAASGGKLGR
jgi:peptide/nickel transport system substrate-binding protein